MKKQISKKPKTNEIADWDDESINRALSATANRSERSYREMCDQRRERDLINESYRLLDEVMYTLTRSATKHIAVGVLPLQDYKPVLRIGNFNLTAAAVFNIEEAAEMFSKLRKIDTDQKVREEIGEKFAARLVNYNIYICKYKNIIFESRNATNVYDSIFISPTTVKKILGMEDHLMALLSSRVIKYKSYPNINMFVNTVALKIMESDEDRASLDLDDLVFKIINKDGERNQILYDLFLKLPTTFKYQVNEKLEYWSENNNYNNI